VYGAGAGGGDWQRSEGGANICGCKHLRDAIHQAATGRRSWPHEDQACSRALCQQCQHNFPHKTSGSLANQCISPSAAPFHGPSQKLNPLLQGGPPACRSPRPPAPVPAGAPALRATRATLQHPPPHLGADHRVPVAGRKHAAQPVAAFQRPHARPARRVPDLGPGARGRDQRGVVRGQREGADVAAVAALIQALAHLERVGLDVDDLRVRGVVFKQATKPSGAIGQFGQRLQCAVGIIVKEC
jgi:hypothetical protein